ncbi:MAG: acetyl-CoA carboxylase subunit beta [Candidatus Coatesbacteria bacterium RBG_13_66_14]|uniref:Acetyl-coenzyme A carboxylase carboxyl transferase subunit beta n=1 Tax=Candidatus Coatesbacteria bacterium RBG_13_66_14 TaxID=1817816 RepID=A0A1F5FIZ8_9BACT|nr:MAG: acetyl-CoA carboxylase subunit beta [Candidatus Coatesbacteria bacterium RBG_13_66_14]
MVEEKAVRHGPTVPTGLMLKCESCGETLYSKQLEENLYVCPKCDFHHKVPGRKRIGQLVDSGSFEEHDKGLKTLDPLDFVDRKPYSQRIAETMAKTGETEAVICGLATMDGIKISLAVMDFTFIGGSMGTVVGEKVTRSLERALKLKIPQLTVCTSGGARMQEGILSLMQMAKSSAACARLREARLPYLVVLTDPTTAGVMASYAQLGDVHIAEPGALMGFAGPRVIEQTIKQKLPPGFQRSEFLQEHGFVDVVIGRLELRDLIVKLLRLFGAG